MESAPLTAAHALARDAIHNRPTSALAAAEKHKAAALEFSRAADGIEDAEALRVLNLLEQHHQRLAQLVSSGVEKPSWNDPVKNDALGNQADHSQPSEQGPSASSGKTTPHVTDSEDQQLPMPKPQRRNPREMSSSIASNLATARGIPSNQHRVSGQASTAAGKSDRKDSKVHAARTTAFTEASKLKSEIRESQAPKSHDVTSASFQPTDKADVLHVERKASTVRTNDDPFQKFYATFEGLLTKLSAPLAFAGLPLVPEEPHEPKATTPSTLPKPPDTPDLTSTSPEISKIFSKAALRAVKEEHGGPGVQESFLVVPTGGGTVSYAGILSRPEQHPRPHPQDSPLEHAEESHEQFVDARELPDMRSSRTVQRASITAETPLTKTAEELNIENESLKQLTDNLSRRLYMWEKSAQSQSMALQQSIRNLQPPNLTPLRAAGDMKGDAEYNERVRELEEQFAAAQRELERYGKENEKLRTVVLRYRERWEKLKEGARVRREGAEKTGEQLLSEA